MSVMRQHWLPEFQYFRALAILEIIAVHAMNIGIAGILLIPSPQREILTTINASALLAIPQFVFISGFVLYNKYKRDFSLRGFYKKRVNSVLWPYLIFSTYYFFYPIVGALLAPAAFPKTAELVGLSGVPPLRAYLIGLGTGSISPMWFILLILQLYVLYPFIVKAYNRAAKHLNVTVGVLGILLTVQLIYTIAVVLPPYFDIGGSTVLFVSAIFYFVLGIFVCDHYESIKNKITGIRLPPLTILVVLAMVSYGVLYNSTFAFQNGVIDPVLAQGSPVVYVWLYAIMQPLFSLMLILFFLKICILWREPRSVATRSMERIGEDSFGIYLTQSFYVGVFGSVLIRLGLGVANLLFYLIVVVSVLVASYVTVHLIYRLPLSEIIVGRPRKSTAM